MQETMIVKTDELRDIESWQDKHNRIVLSAEHLGDGTSRVVALATANTHWYVNVWSCLADVVTIGTDGEPRIIEGDADQLQAVIDHVVHDDHGGALNISGQYYPLSAESERLFQELTCSGDRG